FLPRGPYIVFDAAKDVGVPLQDYVAVPFERRAVTPESQFALDSAIRVIPASELPPVFPTPVEVTQGTGAQHLTALPPVEAPEVLRTLDLLARYKLNVFHLHLTDDEGWRIELPSFPALTAVGARRGHTLDSGTHLPPAFGSGPDVDRPWGSGFYSRADYVEILRYAAARHIEVIPEIEMPGHARAAIKSMEANQQYRLNDPDDRSVYTSAQGYHDNVMNPALESTYRFIERVVGELVAMHREAGVPLRHI